MYIYPGFSVLMSPYTDLANVSPSSTLYSLASIFTCFYEYLYDKMCSIYYMICFTFVYCVAMINRYTCLQSLT